MGSAFTSLYPLSSCSVNRLGQEKEELETMAEIKEGRKNWAGNLTYSANNYHQPGSIEELQAAVKSADKVRTLGTKHCFNRIADSKFNQVSIRSLGHQVDVDKDKMQATIGAGTSYGQICEQLYNQGFALHQFGFIASYFCGRSDGNVYSWLGSDQS